VPWWESWFGEEYLELYPHRDLASARREAAFALARLDPSPEPLLDLCCGSGRHSLRFAEKGLRPFGLDYSTPLLELARSRDGNLRLVRGDMRRLPFAEGAFRSVVNFFTSFGYFMREEDNFAVITEIVRVLAVGGRFLCDTFGPEWVTSRLVPEENRSTADREYRIRRRWNCETRRVEKEIEVRRGGSVEIFRESVRAYSPEELAALIRDAGLVCEKMWGDFDGSPVGPESPRVIALAKKPALDRTAERMRAGR
jgi:ubiquinone/menaquinone biosynthesis C-methylase UbiE